MTSFPSRLFVVLRGLVYGAAFVALWTWLAVLVRRLDALLPVTLPAALAPLGWAVAVAGALLAGVCVAVFLTRGDGTPAPFDPPRAFVAAGPYRFLRNPMYLGGAAAILGAGLVVASPAIVLLALGFFLFFHLFVVLYEEPTLSARFGEGYQRYRENIHRWWPRWPTPGGKKEAP